MSLKESILQDNHFNKSYTNYWEKAVKKSIDGTVIAGPDSASFFLKKLINKKVPKLLDLGCSYGRMGEMLNEFSEKVYGIDPDKSALSKAILERYCSVSVGTGEAIPFPDNFFDFVFCWAVFDVCNQSKTLREISRVLVKNGRAIISGKNANYHDDDRLAFVAEKNAYLKNFPTSFTDFTKLINTCQKCGFIILDFYAFERRGDFGLGRMIRNPELKSPFYEYLICVGKKEVCTTNKLNKITNKHSKYAKKVAKIRGYESIPIMFKELGLS